MSRVVISEYGRSPFTPAYKGTLVGVRPDEMAGQLLKKIVAKSKVDPTLIEDVIMGCAFPEGEQGLNVARLASFIGELPLNVAGVTVNRFCGSSMQSIHMAAANIAFGSGDCFICAGVESMTSVPMTGFNPMPHPGLFESYPEAYEGMGVTAENLANKYNISRKDQEAFAVLSHQKAAAAQKDGRLRDEIIAIEHDGNSIDSDGCIRESTTAEALADLKPAFDVNGSVTAGTSSPLTDGTSAVIVCSEEFADKHSLNKIAAIKSFAVSGCAPEIMGIGPVDASTKALSRAGLSIDDMDIIELNEAFAAQALSVIKELGINQDKLNLDGGAIALGHPLGASGARITGKAASLLVREKGRYALATMCIGGGQGIATVLEAI